jgi:hypothetical protein
MITIPSTNKGQLAMVLIKGTWHAIFYRDKTQCRKNLKTGDREEATKLRNKLFKTLIKEGATVRGPRTVADKIIDKPDLYIYKRPAYSVVIKGKLVGFAETYEEALSLRTEKLKLKLK